MLKKIVAIICIILIILTACSNIKAKESGPVLEVIRRSSEQKQINSIASVTKKIVESDSEKGEVTIELSLKNNKIETEKIDGREVVLVIDNSDSMEEKTETGKTRRDIVVSAAKEFSTQLFKDIDNLKVGIVYYDGVDPQNQYMGTINSSYILSELTDNEEKIQNDLDSFSEEKYGTGTNTDAGLSRAMTMFSEKDNIQKIIILLTDGIPNTANGVSKRVTTTVEAILQKAAEKTRETLNKIDDEKINLITILTGMENYSDYMKNLVESIFGTVEEPTTGLLYNIKDADMEKIIKEKLGQDIQEMAKKTVKNIKVIDYFPKEIVDNFEFSYVKKPNMGTLEDEEEIDSDKRTITWNIDTLNSQETASLRYKLKIKDINNTKLYNKVIATNEKLEITYTDQDEKENKISLEESPTIKLTKEEIPQNNTINTANNTLNNTSNNYTANRANNTPVKNQNGKEDPTIATGVYPKAGKITLIVLMIIGSGIAVLMYVRYNELKDVK